jgi:MoxR-like ATPase
VWDVRPGIRIDNDRPVIFTNYSLQDPLPMSQEAYETSRLLRENIERVVLGKPDVVQMLAISLLAGDHVLLEDVPGVGKTLAAKALAQSIDGSFARLQFTPDLLPSDITGSVIYRSDTRDFEFSRGPIFANVILADEINRAPPRTQSALLEAMSEGQVSVDGKTHALPQPFLVVATQNPFEFEGTYALPESQLDRFLLRTSIGYPDRTIEREVMETHRAGEPVDDLQPVISVDAISTAQRAVRAVNFDESLVNYLLDIVDATRSHDGFQVGVSTRGALSFYRACQARAITETRDYVTPDDVKSLAVASLSHRVLPVGIFQGASRDEVETQVSDLLQQIPVPV